MSRDAVRPLPGPQQGSLPSHEERYRKLLESSPDAIYVHVGNGRLAYANPAAARLLGVPSAADLIGRRVLDFVHPEYRALVASRVGQARTAGVLPEPPVVERLVAFDGRDLYVEITGSLIEFDGQPAVQVMLRDVSRRIRTEQALERREAILSAVAHSAELLLRSTDWQQSVGEVLATLGEAAQVSCVYLFQKHLSPTGQTVVSCRHEWVAPGVKPMLGSPYAQFVPLRQRGYGALEDSLSRGEPYSGTSEDVPGSENERPDRPAVHSFCIVPVMVDDDWWGYVGFDVRGRRREWHASERDALLAAAGLLGAAIRRQYAEDAHRESEARFRGVFDASQEAIVILDTNHTVLYANPAALNAMQTPVRQAEDRPLAEVLAHLPERLDVWQARLERAARLGHPISDAEHYRRRGREVFAEWSVIPLGNDQGRTYALALILRDVTEQRLAERALRESEERHRNLFESIGDAFFLFDEDLNLVDCNDSAQVLVGVHRDELPRPVERVARQILLPRGDLESFLLAALQSEGRQRAPGARTAGGDLDEETTYLDLVAYRVCVDGTNQVALLCRDVSEARRLDAALQRSRHLEGLARLASGVAHDYGNILAVIRGECELLEAMLPDGAPAREEAVAIRAMVDMGSSLTERLVAFGRGEDAHDRDAIVLLNGLVRHNEPLLQRLARANVTLTTDLADEPICVRGDDGQYARVLVNLVTNAREAMPHGGSILIRTGLRQITAARAAERDVAPGLYAFLEVGDTGRGIPPEDLDRIFEPYFTTKRAGTGAGLGLSVVLGIVRQAGGFVSVRSRAHKGTRFRVYLPALNLAEELPEG